MIRGSGFIAALIAGPETVMPSEYYPEVFGGEKSDAMILPAGHCPNLKVPSSM
jgi:hypothetical protein